MTRRADMVVVGAGPAGCAAAAALARNGVRVSLCGAQGQREKPCGGGLLPEAITALAALGVSVADTNFTSFMGFSSRRARGLDAARQSRRRPREPQGASLGRRLAASLSCGQLALLFSHATPVPACAASLGPLATLRFAASAPHVHWSTVRRQAARAPCDRPNPGGAALAPAVRFTLRMP